jgi:amidase
MTKNPFDLSRDPGGSSSGTGTSISANFAILGLGEDTGGSIRLPSSFCGLVGLRPTPGLISRSGLCPLNKTTDTPGPMTRTVRDAALMLDVLVGFDEADPWTPTAVINGPPAGRSYASNLEINKDLISRSRVGVVGGMFGENSDQDCAAVKSVIEKAFKTLGESGTTFIDIEIPNMAETLTFTQTYTSRSQSDIDSYLATTKLNTTCSQIYAQKAFHPNLDLFASICTSPSTPLEDPHYLQRLEDREAFVMTVIQLMAKNDVTALVFPTAKIPAPLHSDVGRWDPWGFPTNTLLASALRFPAISVPVGFTKDGERGLPVGLEIVGLPGREQMLLEMAYGVEELVGARKAPKLGF